MPWDRATGSRVMIPHIMRYAWASQFAWGKTVADLCCGSGYGSFVLSWVARRVTGIDIDVPAIIYAQSKFRADNLIYKMGDVTMPEQRIFADLYVAFECLEHLDEPGELVVSLNRPLVWSIPVKVSSKWHKRVYSVAAIKQLMDGSDFWYQSKEGEIVRADKADFGPAYVLGMRA